MGKDIITEGVGSKRSRFVFCQIGEDGVTSKHIFAKNFSKVFCISVIFTNFVPFSKIKIMILFRKHTVVLEDSGICKALFYKEKYYSLTL